MEFLVLREGNVNLVCNILCTLTQAFGGVGGLPPRTL